MSLHERSLDATSHIPRGPSMIENASMLVFIALSMQPGSSATGLPKRVASMLVFIALSMQPEPESAPSRAAQMLQCLFSLLSRCNPLSPSRPRRNGDASMLVFIALSMQHQRNGDAALGLSASMLVFIALSMQLGLIYYSSFSLFLASMLVFIALSMQPFSLQACNLKVTRLQCLFSLLSRCN